MISRFLASAELWKVWTACFTDSSRLQVTAHVATLMSP